MKTKKQSKCPSCCPNDAFAFFYKEIEFDDDGKSSWIWKCSNCGFVKKPGKTKLASPEKIEKIIEKCSSALRKAGTSNFPVTCKHERSSLPDSDLVFVKFEAKQNAENPMNMLTLISTVDLHIMIRPTGGWEVLSVSWFGGSTTTKAQLKKAKEQINRGWLYASTLKKNKGAENENQK